MKKTLKMSQVRINARLKNNLLCVCLESQEELNCKECDLQTK